jgi:hypothetical protein
MVNYDKKDRILGNIAAAFEKRNKSGRTVNISVDL